MTNTLHRFSTAKSFTDDNIVLFLHGATSPSTCDFDLEYQDYSWSRPNR